MATIGIDIRSLHTGAVSGVENYIINTIAEVLRQDHENHFQLLYNAFRPIDVAQFSFANSEVKATRIPNRLLNLMLLFLKYPHFEKLYGPMDWLWLPNLNPFAVSDTCKLALTVHDLSALATPETFSAKSRLWHTLLNYKKSTQRADLIFAVSEFTKHDLMERLGVPESKIVVTDEGVKHSAYHQNLSEEKLRALRNRYRLPPHFVLFINTVEPRKNLKNVIKAFELMDTPCHLVIGGRLGWKYKDIVSAWENSSKKKFIHYLGYVPEDDKPYLIKLARIFTYPSFYEGFGLQILEGMAVGTPVITSQVTSMPEVAGDGALLVDPYYVGGMARAMDLLMTDEAVRDRFIQKGLLRAQKYSWERTASVMLKAFKERS